jgi:Tol biopolymer transport system component
MNRLQITQSIVLVLWFSTFTSAAPPQRTHDITIDDLFTLGWLTECATSRDGRYIAFTQGRWLESADDRKKDVWLIDANDESTRRLTFDRANDHRLQWSRDNREIYFLGQRSRPGEKSPPYDGTIQVWRIGLDGGVPLAVTRQAGGVATFVLSADTKSLFYTTNSDKRSGGEWAGIKSAFSKIHYGGGWEYSTSVYKLNLEDWRIAKVCQTRGAVHDEFDLCVSASRPTNQALQRV